MNINLHIERLVLDGLSITEHGGAALRASIELELARLLAEQPGANWRNTNLPRLQLSLAAPNKDGGPKLFGREIARTLHGGLSKA